MFVSWSCLSWRTDNNIVTETFADGEYSRINFTWKRDTTGNRPAAE